MNVGDDSRTAILLLCRQGFERECGQEFVDRAGSEGVATNYRSVPGTGLVHIETYPPSEAPAAMRAVDLQTLIFTRQMFWSYGEINELPKTDRVGAIMTALAQVSRTQPWTSVEVFVQATQELEALQRFARKFASPMAAALRKDGKLHDQRSDVDPLVVIFESFDTAIIASLDPANQAATLDGIPRLKMPADAPSRSTLKLEEAWHVFIGKTHWYDVLGSGKKAVDLGAAPGGWTWQLVQQGMDVIAVDNGDMDAELMKSGHVTHLRADGFTYRPSEPVDWMVCDMVEQPSRVIDLVGRWLASGWCRYSVFNLKLPMKKRYPEVQKCLAELKARLNAAELRYIVAARQLYHDREEITCYVEILGRRPQ